MNVPAHTPDRAEVVATALNRRRRLLDVSTSEVRRALAATAGEEPAAVTLALNSRRLPRERIDEADVRAALAADPSGRRDA